MDLMTPPTAPARTVDAPPRAPGRRLGRVASRVAVVLAAVTLVPVFLLWLFQGAFIYAPSDDVYPVDPIAAGVVDVAYRTADGIDLHGWFLAAARPPEGCAAAPTAVLFHGQAGNKTYDYPTAATLAARGINVLLAEYRGFGGASGTPSEDGFALDARAARDAVLRLPGVDAAHLVYIGSSLGTGVATRLATEVPSAGLVLLSPYTWLPDVAAARMPGLPYGLLLRDRYDTIDRIGSLDMPTLFVLGTADQIVPAEQSRRVHAAARRAEPLVELPGIGHEAITITTTAASTAPVTAAITRWTCGGDPPAG